MRETIKIQISTETGRWVEDTLYRVYTLEDGQLPDNMQEKLQDMVDTLLDNEEKF